MGGPSRPPYSAEDLMDNTVAQDTPLSLLTREGVIGFYTDIEVTEIVAFRVGIGQPLNVFTLLVAEERGDGAAFAEGFLNSKRIRVPTLKQWSFGIFRYRRPVGDVIALLDGKPSVDTWSLSGNCVEIGRLLASGPFVVPPRRRHRTPLEPRSKKQLLESGLMRSIGTTPRRQPSQTSFYQPRRLCRNLPNASGSMFRSGSRACPTVLATSFSSFRSLC